MNWVELAAVIVTAIATGVLAWFTRVLAATTKASTEVAVQSNKAAAQQRVDDASPLLIAESKTSDQGYWIFVTNAGRGVALAVRSRTFWGGEGFPGVGPTAWVERYVGTLSPGETVRVDGTTTEWMRPTFAQLNLQYDDIDAVHHELQQVVPNLISAEIVQTTTR